MENLKKRFEKNEQAVVEQPISERAEFVNGNCVVYKIEEKAFIKMDEEV